MDFASSFLPESIGWSCNLVALLLSLYVVSTLDWLKTYRTGVFNIWVTAVFCLGLIWMIRANLHFGLNIHLSGAMLMTLMFGWRLGVLGMTAVCILVSLWGNSLPWNLGISLFINAYLSVSLCYLLFLIVEAFLPRNLFIYLFLTAFFSAALSFIVTGTISVLFLGVFEAFPWSVLLHDYLPYYYLMSFGEAFITCGLITLFVVYCPRWVYSFRDERYLNRK